MRSFEFASVPGGEKDVRVEWGKVKEKETRIAVEYRGSPVERFDEKELEAGKTVAIPDAGTLRLFYRKTLLTGKFLDAEMNGKPVEEAPGSVGRQLTGLWGLLFFLGGTNVLLGLIQAVTGDDTLFGLGFTFLSVIAGAVWIVLAVFIMRKSLGALIAMFVIYILNFLSHIYLAIASGAGLTASLAIPVLIILYMIQAMKLLADYRKDLKSKRDA